MIYRFCLCILNLCNDFSIDYIAVGSNSGGIVILEYNSSKHKFEKVHQQKFGESGSKRIEAGQYLAVDPKGRALMIGM